MSYYTSKLIQHCFLIHCAHERFAYKHRVHPALAQRANIRLLPVPYKGVGSIQDLVGGQVDVLMTSAASVDGLVETGKVRVLGTFTTARLPKVGDAPTVADIAAAIGPDSDVLTVTAEVVGLSVGLGVASDGGSTDWVATEFSDRVR